MVLDNSAIVAIHLKEPGHESLLNKIDTAPIILIGVPTVFETAMVLSARLGVHARSSVHAFLVRAECELVAFNAHHLDTAISAFWSFGRGRHPAALNFGDCMSYAVAAVSNMPLLFTGNDFARTDILRA